MKLKGEVQLVLRDVATGEVAHDSTTPNIITEWFYSQLTSSPYLLNFSLVIQGTQMVSSRYNRRMPGNFNGNLAAVPDAVIPSVGVYTTWFPPVGPTPGFLQISGRYNPPSANRTFNTVAVVGGAGNQNNLNYNNVNGAGAVTTAAYAPLASPCTQTTTQVLDVYYRIYVQLTTVGAQIPQSLSDLLSRLTQAGNNIPFYDYQSNAYSELAYQTLYPTPISVLKGSDVGTLSPTSQVAHWASNGQNWFVSQYYGADATTNPLVSTFNTRRLNNKQQFTDNVGRIFSGMVSGGYQTVNDYLNTSSVSGPIALAWNNLSGPNKIQNLIGHGTAARPFTSSPFLDVDNLPQGSGVVNLGGNWNNRGTPAVAGMYYQTKLPQWNSIQITTSGQVSDGTAAYQYVTCPFFGFAQGIYAQATYQYVFPMFSIPSMCAAGTPVDTSNGTAWSHLAYDAGKTLPGDISESKMGVRQVSATHRYDDTSYIMVKRDLLILYSIGSGDYWKISGSFTNVHQVAVANGKIYIACRNTGLYVVDPTQNLSPTSLSAPAAGIDLSACYGVHLGFGSSIWAVGKTGLAKLDSGGTWTLYNATSSPALSITGVSDSNWSNIDYLKIDIKSSTFQMMLVRSLNATVNATSFGVWWSTSTAAANAFNDSLSQDLGRPRTNRTHFGGNNGQWGILDGGYLKTMGFGSTPIQSGVQRLSDLAYTDVTMSLLFVTKPDGTSRILSLTQQATSVNWQGTGGYLPLQQLVDVTGTVTDTLIGGNIYNDSIGPTGRLSARARSSTDDGTYGHYDHTSTIILAPGVLVYTWIGTINGNTYGKMDNLIAAVSNFGLDPSLSGGSLGWLALTTYGWNGTSWDPTSTGSRPVHASNQPLLDGVTVRFTDGTSGQSFTVPNYYKFGLCEGLLKDNATAFNIQSTFYFRPLTPNYAVLTANTVPTVTAQGTGLVGLNSDLSKSTTGATTSGNQIVLPGVAGLQYALGSKQVSNDFEIQYGTSDLSSAQTTMQIMCGVGKRAVDNMPQFGFAIVSGELYGWSGTGADLSKFVDLNTAASAVTDLRIKRIGGVLGLYVNGALRFSDIVAQSNIRAGDQRLDVMFSTYPAWDLAAMTGNNRFPTTTINSNGSDGAVFVGDGTSTGIFGPRFFGIDSDAPGVQKVTIGGVAAVVKGDGTLPAAGECTIDGWSGALYFNSADIGKAITALLTYQST